MRSRIILFGVACGASVLTWLFYAWISKPSDHDFMVTATSYYFKRMSEKGLLQIASYDDCKVVTGDSKDKADGISRFGLCSTSDGETNYYFTIAMNVAASYVYADLEEREI